MRARYPCLHIDAPWRKSFISHTGKFALDITHSRPVTLHLVVATVHLPTCKCTASFVKFLSAPTSSCLRHTKLPYAAISEIFSLHRPSPLATQQPLISMTAASLDIERWQASEVVLLDIGKSAQLHCSTSLYHHQLRRERLQPAPTNRRDARNLPVAGLASNQPKHSRQEAAHSGSRCVAAHSRALATPGSAHATAVLAIHMSQSHTFRRLQP
jgi:hypothetical protein